MANLTKTTRKRSTQAPKGPSKKRKLATPNPIGARKHKLSKKKTASDKDIIAIPVPEHDIDLSDQDLDVLDAYGDAALFLDELDHNGIARSKKETIRLHRLNRRIQKPCTVDDLPSVDSHDEDEASWSSNIDEESSSPPESDGTGSTASDDDAQNMLDDLNSDTEMPYESLPRKRRPSWDSDQDSGIPRLPIKLPDGRIQKLDNNVTSAPVQAEIDVEDEDEDEEASNSKENKGSTVVEDISTGARFGRPAIVDVIGQGSRNVRIQGAKEEIARICQSILAEPENGLGLLRRLHTFSLPKISTPSHPDPVVNDPIIRKLAILSQLAVFKDIIPGYRIRPLTDAEKAEKISQQVSRLREWEQGLVVAYQSYLRTLESELKAKSELAEVALQCICTLAAEVTHFNFSINLMGSIVAQMSRKSWDKSSEMCLKTVIQAFRSDLTGISSLEIVRLLNRMIKEKRFNVHPRVLSCLVHLRLKTELKIRTSDTTSDKAVTKSYTKSKAAARRAKGKATDQPYASKKARKAMNEQKEIDRELRDAEAEIDKEQRDARQTETLKLLFVLYFRILKNPHPTSLLPAALQGISKFAHLVNIDFFEDLMKVLKNLISRDSSGGSGNPKDGQDIQHRLLCLLTAFELLSGQGEALNIDLSDFVAELYAIILSLSLMPNIESQTHSSSSETDLGGEKHQDVIAVLFRALTMAFSPRSFGTTSPPWRSAAFAKRILFSSLQWPPDSILQALGFVAGLIVKDPMLETLLNTEERSSDGQYRPDVDDPQLCNPFGTSFWELHILRRHWHPKVREEADKLARFVNLG